jgi:diguanylate cyclase (GGDEF)-like protein
MTETDTLRQQVLTLLSESERLDGYMLREIEKFAALRSNFFAKTLEKLVQQPFGDDDARGHWQGILQNLEQLNGALKRNVGLKPAVLDYFLNRKNAAETPFVVDMHFFREQERLDMIDELTGMFNRGYFHIALNKEVKRADRYNKIFSLVLFAPDALPPMDADHKLSNLQIIRRFGHEVNECIRAEDTLCRYDNERFCVLLPETSDEGAAAFVRRIQYEMNRQPFFKESSFTCGAGLAAYPYSAETAEGLVAFMENSLYEAQQEGRNNVGVAIKDKRKHKRFFMTWKVTYQILDEDTDGEGESKECLSQDVSTGGLSLETNRELERGAKMLLVLRPSLMPTEIFKVVGVVRQVTKINLFKYSYGIEFHNLTEEQRDKLRRILPTHEVRM